MWNCPFILALATAAALLFPCSAQPQSDGIVVTGHIFTGTGRDGDFAWMIVQEQYRDVLFIFNDNEDQYKAHRDDPTGAEGCTRGGGNAVIRPYQCLIPARAAGIPTGPNYPSLTPDVKRIIDEAIMTIRNIVAREHYARIMYNARNADGDLGTGIFSPGEDVKDYIVSQLRAIQNSSARR